MKVGLVLGAGGVLGGAWHTGALAALAQETDWDPASAEYIVGTSAGSLIGSLVAAGVPPWFMVAHSAGETFEGLNGPDGRPARDADRSGGANFSLHRGLPALGPGSLRMAAATLANPLRDRKSTRLNSSHTVISYAVFCLKKKNRRRAGAGKRESQLRHQRPS